MAEQIFMDIPAVKNFSSMFGGISDTLQGVSKTLENLSNILKTTAFIGNVGGAALAQMIDSINPYIKQVSDKCAEEKKDVMDSVLAFERGDQAGATRFY
jgi:hypothetical protein